jgi:agmatine/peptidylarginine deiminase
VTSGSRALEVERRAELVPDWDTKRVLLVLPVAEMELYGRFLPELEYFYAELLRELARHEEVACLVPDAARAEKMMRLSGLGAEHFLRASLPDIWIRDFAPLCTNGEFVRFDHEPSADPRAARACRAFAAHLGERRIPARREPIALAGGNFVHNGAGVGVTTRALVVRNRGRAAAERLRSALGLKRLVLLPQAPGDPRGHVDGMLRFAGPELLVVNDYARLEGGREFQRRLDEILDARLCHALRVMLPFPRSRGTLEGWSDARVNYANFLLTGQRVYVPLFGVPEDREAEAVFECVFPGRTSYVYAGAIARYGGGLNAIGWSYV